MGTLALLALFGNLRDAYVLAERLKAVTTWPAKYGVVHLKNDRYGLDREIDLLIKYGAQKTLTGSSQLYDFDIDIPVEHISLEGPFQVKESRRIALYVFGDELPGYALLVSDRKDVFRYFAYALTKLIGIQLYSVALRADSVVLEELARLYGGRVKWVVVSGIRDTELSSAQFYGERLEESEIVSDVASRGKITALKIYDPRRKLVITLSSSGRIYTPQTGITPQNLAAMLNDALKFFHERRLLERGRLLSQLSKPAP